MFLVPRDTPGFRIGKVFNKSGWRFYQNARDDLRERARAARQRRGRGQRRGHEDQEHAATRTGGDIFGDLELAANALGVCEDACEWR